MPSSGNGSTLAMSASAAITHLRALFGTDRFSVQASSDIGNRERVGVLTDRVAALMTDQVDLHKTGCRVVPLRPGADRDGVLEQRTGLGVATATQRHRSPVRRQALVHRGRRHGRQSGGQFVADVELTEAPQRCLLYTSDAA